MGFYCVRVESIIDNHKPRKEPLASDLIGEGYDGFANKDYKDVLAEGQDEKGHIYDISVTSIREMPVESDRQATKKAIMSLLWFGVPKRRILRLLGIGRTLFCKLVKETRQEIG
jgi:hypothetical protein